MILIINEVEYNVDLTEHETTQDEQLEVFWGEMDEFDRALYIEDKYCVAQECIDCIKSLAKWLKYDSFSEIKMLLFKYSSSNEMIKPIDGSVEEFREDSCYLCGQSLMQDIINFLYLFCKENNLNITEQFKINNDKTNNRGTKKKVYLSVEEVIDMIEISNKLLNLGLLELSQKQQNIIDKIEG